MPWLAIAALGAALASCGLRDGKKAPLRALYFDDSDNWGLPTEANEPEEVHSSEPDASPPVGIAPSTSQPTSRPSSSTQSPDPPPTDDCPAEANGLALGDTCSVGVGACSRTSWVECVDSELRCTAVAASPTEEVCNGGDDDCDGVVDNLTPCSVGVGACSRTGTVRCSLGEPVCEGAPGVPGPETCNGIDDDCDGQVDEQLRLDDSCSAGIGECKRYGDHVCSDGKYTCEATAGDALPEDCNGVDDDCDGVIDNGLPTYGACSAGVGECEREGQFACAAGQWQCDATPAAASTEECNGVDDDCDGQVDESVTSQPCSVGIGACARTGNTMCVDSAPSCNVTPRSPGEEECNDIDDDCDGEIDEDFDLGAACSAGVGPCERTGVRICSNDGSVVCSASPAQPSTELCNDIDDNCDGEADNKHVCPDDTVANVLPFTAGVWYVATTSDCNQAKVIQVYPTVDETTYYSGFPCYSGPWVFRPNDGGLTYLDGYAETIDLHQGQAGLTLASLDGIQSRYGFDGQGTPYYFGQDDVLRRGAGEVVASNVDFLYAVAADGRSLVNRDSAIVLLDSEGSELEVIDPELDFEGTMDLLDAGTSAAGSDLLLLYNRTLSFEAYELVLLRIDSTNAARLVRRVSLGAQSPAGLFQATSDGSIFQMAGDPDAETGQELIRHYAPDGTVSVIWRETEAAFGTHGPTQFLIGPRL